MTLDSGVTLLYQRNHISDTNALGIWIKHGSRDEAPSERGLSHLLEHMVFRGARRRDALQIARDLEAIGGQWDAFTGKETTSYNAKVLPEHFGELVDIYSDLLVSPSIPAEAFKIEQNVVQEEIRGIMDSPEEYTHEIFIVPLKECKLKECNARCRSAGSQRGNRIALPACFKNAFAAQTFQRFAQCLETDIIAKL